MFLLPEIEVSGYGTASFRISGIVENIVFMIQF
jgi:hypothetical protein